MDSRIVRTIVMLGVGLSAALHAGNVVFDEDFEGEPYGVGTALPTGHGTIRHGQWVELARDIHPGMVIEKDGRHAMELALNEQEIAKVRAIGSFGRDNQESTPVTEELDVRITFQVSQLLDETFSIQLLGKDGKSRATIGMGEWGGLSVSFGGKRTSLGPNIKPGVWYELQLLMPANPVTKSTFVANLYEGDGKTLLDSLEGRVSRSVEEGGSSYSGIDIQHQMQGASLLIDKIKATTLP